MGQAEAIGIVAQNVKSLGNSELGRRLAAVAGAVLLALTLFIGASAWYMSYVPADLDTSAQRLSENGHFKVLYESSPGRIPINELHTWTIRIATPEGEAVEDATISINGDMPQHGHGLPTQPQVTAYLGDGYYQIEGVKFQMRGWWFMEFQIAAHGREDRVRFDFVLP